MNSTVVTNLAPAPVSNEDGSPMNTARQLTSKTPVPLWMWMIVACLLLGISGGIRFWRDRQFQALAAENAACPFPLRDFPNDLGTWQVDANTKPEQLDPEVVRIAGSSDHIIRTYIDKKSGEVVTVLILYGLANSVFAHTPEVCYPAAGYQAVDVPTDHEFSMSGLATPVRFRSAFFSKQAGGISQYQEVYYTFMHNGQWLPEVESRWKMFRYHPGMFKVQIQCAALGQSKDSENNPIRSLLREIVQEIDCRTSANKIATASLATPSKG
jgi:hypothetical protein